MTIRQIVIGRIGDSEIDLRFSLSDELLTTSINNKYITYITSAHENEDVYQYYRLDDALGLITHIKTRYGFNDDLWPDFTELAKVYDDEVNTGG